MMRRGPQVLDRGLLKRWDQPGLLKRLKPGQAPIAPSATKPLRAMFVVADYPNPERLPVHVSRLGSFFRLTRRAQLRPRTATARPAYCGLRTLDRIRLAIFWAE
jgi:hypothetical protein